MYLPDNEMSIHNKNLLCSPIDDSLKSERDDYLNEMLYVMVNVNDKVIHSGNLFRLFNYVESDGDLVKVYKYKESFIEKNKKDIFFWTQYLIGHSSYNGGWFTYNNDISGPAAGSSFGFCLEYNVKKEFPILFIPPVYKDKILNESYYDKSADVDYKIVNTYISENKWSGSHIIEGVKNWNIKNYEKIQHPMFSTYADNLAKKIIKLGFNGYVSCDECEIFMSHRLQVDVLDRKPRFYINQKYWQIYGKEYDKNINYYNDLVNYMTREIIYENNITTLVSRDKKEDYREKAKKYLETGFKQKDTKSPFDDYIEITPDNGIRKSFYSLQKK